MSADQPTGPLIRRRGAGLPSTVIRGTCGAGVSTPRRRREPDHRSARVRMARSERRPVSRARAARKAPTRMIGVESDPGRPAGGSVAVGGRVIAGVDEAAGEAAGLAPGVPEGDAEGLAAGEAFALVEGDGAVPAEQVAREIVSLIRVTSPLRASARPLSVTPLFIVIDVRARMVPANVEPEPSVAELVTCQKTLQGWAPLMNRTVLEEAVTRSDVAWKIQTALGSFWPSRVRVPVRPRVLPPAV